MPVASEGRLHSSLRSLSDLTGSLRNSMLRLLDPLPPKVAGRSGLFPFSMAQLPPNFLDFFAIKLRLNQRSTGSSASPWPLCGHNGW